MLLLVDLSVRRLVTWSSLRGALSLNVILPHRLAHEHHCGHIVRLLLISKSVERGPDSVEDMLRRGCRGIEEGLQQAIFTELVIDGAVPATAKYLGQSVRVE